jgi:hypothetical protein
MEHTNARAKRAQGGSGLRMIVSGLADVGSSRYFTYEGPSEPRIWYISEMIYPIIPSDTIHGRKAYPLEIPRRHTKAPYCHCAILQ